MEVRQEHVKLNNKNSIFLLCKNSILLAVYKGMKTKKQSSFQIWEDSRYNIKVKFAAELCRFLVTGNGYLIYLLVKHEVFSFPGEINARIINTTLH